MRVEKRQGSHERQILTGMIVSDLVCGKIATLWQGDQFNAKSSNLIGGWAVAFYNKYGTAPGKSIEGLFESWASDSKDKETIRLVEKFLSTLSDEYETLAKDVNENYIIDMAAKHFNKVAMARLFEAGQGDLDSDDLEKAMQRIQSFGKIEIGVGSGIDVLQSASAIQEAFEQKREPLIIYPDPVAAFFGDSLERDGFICIQAPEKRGKCVSEDMEVVLSNGEVKTIQEIVEKKIKTPILSYNEKTMRFERKIVSDFFDNGVKPCVEVETRTGRKVQTTSNHEYLTPDGWKFLEDIKPGEFIAVPKHIPFFGKIRMREEEVKWLAYIMAEGCCVGTSCSFTNTDPILIADFEDCCNKMGISHRRTGISNHLRCESRPFLKKFGIFGQSSKTKVVPQQIFKAPKDQVALFLKVFFSCDGCIYLDHKKYKIELTLANEKLLRQISHLLLRFGVVHRLFRGDVTRKSDGKVFEAWRLVIGSLEYVKLFLDEIGLMSYKDKKLESIKTCRSFLDKFPAAWAERFYNEIKVSLGGAKKEGGSKSRFHRTFTNAAAVKEQFDKGNPIMRQSFSDLKGYPIYKKYMGSHILWDEVVSIKKVGKKRTYDLTVEGNHNFIANDVLVHNTFVLLDLAWRGMEQRRKVAFFQVGDMSQSQMMRRFMIRAAKRPLKARTIKYPTSITLDLDESPYAIVEHEERVFEKPLGWRTALKACARIIERKCKTQETLLKLACYPNSTLSVNGLKAVLQGWERDGWVPDIVVIDYADILAPISGVIDSREQINATWKALRALSQSLHCLVITATQAKASSYKVETMDMEHFADDKRKYAHVTGTFSINRTREEKENGVMRWNWIVLREDEFQEGKCVHVAGCLAIANPCIRGVF